MICFLQAFQRKATSSNADEPPMTIKPIASSAVTEMPSERSVPFRSAMSLPPDKKLSSTV